MIFSFNIHRDGAFGSKVAANHTLVYVEMLEILEVGAGRCTGHIMRTTVAAIKLVDQFARDGGCLLPAVNLFIVSHGCLEVMGASYLMSTHVKRKYQRYD